MYFQTNSMPQTVFEIETSLFGEESPNLSIDISTDCSWFNQTFTQFLGFPNPIVNFNLIRIWFTNENNARSVGVIAINYAGVIKLQNIPDFNLGRGAITVVW